MATLPEPVKKAIASFDWAREVFDIGRKHSMHVDRIGELQTEVMLVVLGLVSPRDFQNELFDRIEPNREIALEISDEVNQKVFIRIRDFMKEYYERNENSVAPAKAPEVVKPASAGGYGVAKDDEIGSSERQVLHGAGIKIGDEVNEPEPEPEEEPVDDDGAISFYQEKESVAMPKIDPVVTKVTEVMSKPEIHKSKISVITEKDAPKGFLDPYREPVE